MKNNEMIDVYYKGVYFR